MSKFADRFAVAVLPQALSATDSPTFANLTITTLITAASLTLTSALRFNGFSTGTATAGAAVLPANPVGFITINVDGTNRKFAYYAT